MSTDTVVTVAKTGLDAKREEAKALLGANWVGHPDYRTNPRHSTCPDIYVQARQPYLRGVCFAAQQDRARNPAFLRVENLRHAFSTL